jgi:hypothetical protein
MACIVMTDGRPALTFDVDLNGNVFCPPRGA